MPKVVQIPPTEIAKVKQQLESERIQLAKQRREIQAAQNRAAAIKQGIGVAMTLGTGALALYKIGTQKQATKNREALEKWNLELKEKALEQQEKKAAREEEKAARDELRKDLLAELKTKALEHQIQREESRKQREQDKKEQTAPSPYVDVLTKYVGPGILSTAKTTGTVATQAATVLKTGVSTAIDVGKNAGSFGLGTLVLYGGYLYLIPSARPDMFRSAAEAASYATFKTPFNIAKGFREGMYSAVSSVGQEILRDFKENDPFLNEMRRLEKEGQAQVPPTFLPNLDLAQYVTVPTSKEEVYAALGMDAEEFIRRFGAAAASATSSEGLLRPVPAFPRRATYWTENDWKRYKSLTMPQQAEVDKNLPRGTLTSVKRKFSQS